MSETTPFVIVDPIYSKPKSISESEIAGSPLFDYTSAVVMTLSAWIIITLLSLSYQDEGKGSRIPIAIFEGHPYSFLIFFLFIFLGFCASWVSVVVGLSVPKMLISYELSKLLVRWCSLMALSALLVAGGMFMFLSAWDLSGGTLSTKLAH